MGNRKEAEEGESGLKAALEQDASHPYGLYLETRQKSHKNDLQGVSQRKLQTNMCSAPHHTARSHLEGQIQRRGSLLTLKVWKTQPDRGGGDFIPDLELNLHILGEIYKLSLWGDKSIKNGSDPLFFCLGNGRILKGPVNATPIHFSHHHPHFAQHLLNSSNQRVDVNVWLAADPSHSGELALAVQCFKAQPI